MEKELHFDKAAEREATDIGARFMHSTDVVGDMSRAYGRDLSSVRIHTDESAARGAAERGVDAFSTGKDVFFGRGAFDRNDPASRGLLAHELSHSMQQGVGGDAPALTQSAPMGAEQGGLREWFRRLFGKSEDEENAGIDEASALPAEAGHQEEAAAANAAIDHDPQAKLTDLVWQLAESSKSGFGRNSDYFDNVIDSSITVNGILNGGRFTNQLQNNLQMLAQAQNAYQTLLDACTAYTARSPHTSSGKHRRSIVLQIQELAQKDLLGLSDAISDFCAMDPDEQAEQTWSSVLGKARSIRLSVQDYSQMTAATGGAVSEVYKIDGSNTSVKNSDGSTTALNEMKFFKPEDSIDISSPNGAVVNKDYYIALNETLKAFPNLPEQDVETLKEFVQKKTAGNYDRTRVLEGNLPNRLSEAGREAFIYFSSQKEKVSTAVAELLDPSGTLSQPGPINTTRRNVATSRMASLLGLDHLIAKSQTAEIYDEATGKTYRGNVMDKARGEENRTIQEKLAKNQSYTKGDMSNFTAGFQRDMVNLQVLDVLCGQMDRHANNMFYQMNENGKFTGVQGIDNDGSFGLNTDVISTKRPNRADRRVYNPESGELVLPYMDAALAERILALDGEVVRYALQDLLTQAEIAAAIRRLTLMKAAITTAKQAEEADPDAPRRFLQDDEWTEETAQRMVNDVIDLEATSKLKEYKYDNDKIQGSIKEMVRYIYYSLGNGNPTEATEKLLKTKDAERDPEQKRIYSLAFTLAGENFFGRRMKNTLSNATYFGSFAGEI